MTNTACKPERVPVESALKRAHLSVCRCPSVPVYRKRYVCRSVYVSFSTRLSPLRVIFNERFSLSISVQDVCGNDRGNGGLRRNKSFDDICRARSLRGFVSAATPREPASTSVHRSEGKTCHRQQEQCKGAPMCSH